MIDRVGDIFEVIDKRRTVRQFKACPVPEADLKRILDAARKAPSSGNQQGCKFLVIQDCETIARLREQGIEWALEYVREQATPTEEQLEECRRNSETYLDGTFAAPVLIAVLGDQEAKYPAYLKHDGPLAAANLMLAARALGYGTVYGTDIVSLKSCEVL